MLHDAGQSKVRQLAHIAPRVIVGCHGRLEEHICALEVSLQRHSAAYTRHGCPEMALMACLGTWSQNSLPIYLCWPSFLQGNVLQSSGCVER